MTEPGHTLLAARLRARADTLRRQPQPLAELIPLLQEAADALEQSERTGLDPEMGFILEAATAGELAAYDYGCQGMMQALAQILDGQDDGAGIANQPWEGLRRRVLELMDQRKPS